MPRKKKNNTGIPDFEIDCLARALLPAIQQLFETEEVKREFEKWQTERQRQLNNKNLNQNSVVLLMGYILTFFSKKKVEFDSTGAIIGELK